MTKPARTLLLKELVEICRSACRNLPEEQKAGGTAATPNTHQKLMGHALPLDNPGELPS